MYVVSHSFYLKSFSLLLHSSSPWYYFIREEEANRISADWSELVRQAAANSCMSVCPSVSKVNGINLSVWTYNPAQRGEGEEEGVADIYRLAS